jgi:DNA-binding CsgD family transcriptional regulator
MLGLVNEVHASASGDVGVRVNHFLRGLCDLVHAKVGVIALLRDTGAATWEHASHGFFEFGWPSEAERSAVMAYHDDARRDPAKYADPMIAMLAEPARVVTRRRSELHDDGFWYSRANVNEHRRPGRIDDCVYSLHRVAAGWIVGIGLHREWGDRKRFSRHDASIIQILHEQSAFLWRDVIGEGKRDRGEGIEAGLSERLRQTLMLLMSGASEKEIAMGLNVSRNTVHKYVTAVYRRFGVNSRAELMARRLGKTLRC